MSLLQKIIFEVSQRWYVQWFFREFHLLGSHDYLKWCLLQICFFLRLPFWQINIKRGHTMTISTKQGIFTVSNDWMGRSLYCYREYESSLTKTVIEFLRQQDRLPVKGQGTILDIGANIGVTSIGMLSAGEFERAIAIEPEPRNLELLQQNVKQNKFSERILCLPYAAADQKGELSFELSESNFGDHRIRSDASSFQEQELYHESARRMISIQADTVDHLCKTIPDIFTKTLALLWIDVQGYEGYALRGGGQYYQQEFRWSANSAPIC